MPAKQSKFRASGHSDVVPCLADYITVDRTTPLQNRGLQHCGAGLHPCKIGDYITVARRRREKNSIFEGVSPLKTVFLPSQNAQNRRLRRAKISIEMYPSQKI